MYDSVPIAWAWEPVMFWGGRRRPPHLPTLRDWISEAMTLRRGLVGVKPDAVCRWAFEMLGMDAGDELHDLFPGSGAVTQAWAAWRAAPRLGSLEYTGKGATFEATLPLEEAS
jgi:hypothetical protein